MSTDLHPPPTERSPFDKRTMSKSSSASSAAWIVGGLLLAGMLLAIVWGIAKTAFTPEQDKHFTHVVSRGRLTVSVTEQGTLASSNNTEIICRVRGHNMVTYVVPGGTVVEKGDELVRLDTKVVEEAYSLTKTNTHIATATLERSRADAAKAEIAIDAYLEGRYRNRRTMLENELHIAERNLETSKTMHTNSKSLFEQGFVTALEVESNAFTVTQAELELKVQQTRISVLDDFTKKMELETLRGSLTASRSKLQADEAGLKMEKARRRRAKEDVDNCLIIAERPGLVIYPSAAAWKNTPDIAQGVTVRKDQVLLLMPDLTQMEVKVGIHESIIDRIQPGLSAKVTLPDQSLEATVSKVAAVTKPAGWWTGNVVKYDTVIQLPEARGLKPGMSAEVEVIMAVHEDVLTIPVACVLDSNDRNYCWVKTAEGPRRRVIKLGDTNDAHTIVLDGLSEGEEVILNPLAFADKTADSENRTAIAETTSPESRGPRQAEATDGQ